MRRMNKLTLATLSILVMTAGCSTTKNAVFVTKSSISVVDIDKTPASFTFAYDRTEGVFGPNYENGAVPSVVGFISTDGDIINPEIKQLYATGEAADIVVDPSGVYKSDDKVDGLTGDREPLFFGTSTTFGFKIGVTGSDPSLTLGYKRKEVSVIPLRKGEEGTEDVYSSVLASIDTSVDPSFGAGDNNAEFENGQFFATGVAAKILASQGYMKDIFENRAKTSLEIFDELFNEQVKYQLSISKCSMNIDSTKWQTVIDSGVASNIFPDLNESIKAALSKYKTSGKAEDQLNLIKLHSAGISGSIVGSTPEYSVLLKAHKKLVCG
jgi:hypothetical protein